MKTLMTGIMVLMLAQNAWSHPGDNYVDYGDSRSAYKYSESVPMTDSQDIVEMLQRTESFKVESEGRLVLFSVLGKVTISTWKKNEVSVSIEGIPVEHEDNLLILYDSGMLRIEYTPPRPVWSNRVQFNIDLPSSFDLDILTWSGDIEVIGDLAGTMRGYTKIGDISTLDIEGDADLSTMGGNIRTGMIGDTGYMMTSGGSLRIEGAKGELDVHTTAGDIRLGNIGGALKVHTSGGDISIVSVGGKSRISTASGDIEIEETRGDAQIVTDGGDIEIRRAEGFVRARTAGGDIELPDVRGTIEAKSGGGDLFAGLSPQGNRTSSLVSAGGDIVLLVDPEAKTNIEGRIRARDQTFVTQLEASPISIQSQIRIGGYGIHIGGPPLTDDIMTMEQFKQFIGRKEDSPVFEEVLGDSNLQIITKTKIDIDYQIRSIFEAEPYEEKAGRRGATGSYVLNGGGVRIWLETANGNIDIRKRPVR